VEEGKEKKLETGKMGHCAMKSLLRTGQITQGVRSYDQPMTRQGNTGHKDPDTNASPTKQAREIQHIKRNGNRKRCQVQMWTKRAIRGKSPTVLPRGKQKDTKVQ